MPGVKVGDGCIIGTNAVVAKDIPPYSIAVGNPANVVKRRFDDNTIERLLKLNGGICRLKQLKRIMNFCKIKILNCLFLDLKDKFQFI